MSGSNDPESGNSTGRRAVLASVGSAVATSGLAAAVPDRAERADRPDVELGLIDGIEELDSVEELLDGGITPDDIDVSQIDTTERPSDLDVDRLSDLDPERAVGRLTKTDIRRFETLDIDPREMVDALDDVTLSPPEEVDRAQLLVDPDQVENVQEGAVTSLGMDPDGVQPSHRLCGTTPWAFYSPFPGPNANGCSFPLSDYVLNVGCCNKHDRCYADGGGPSRRAYCDINFFRCQLRDPRVPFEAAWSAYSTVRAFGVWYFNYC